MDLHDLYRRAEWRLAAGDPAGAVTDLHEVLAAEPSSSAASLLLARAYFHSAQLGRAVDMYTALVTAEPANPEAHVGLARSLERLGRYTEALPHARLAAALHPGEEYAVIAERVAARAARYGAPPPVEPAV